ncbi:hypothetical protein DPEC_G00145950 [Dallia pectoralis]|uniref:Uncharacterized protein n=1 Tax=Dallia pectoralis TaxID=75939 RepID=A0ACC2GP25_DALPE|nr:hypothetical protein DPEC_G00145950 [Dallia pectoralis]
MAPGCTVERQQADGRRVMWWTTFSWEPLGSAHSCGRQFDTCHRPTLFCISDKPLHGNDIP